MSLPNDIVGYTFGADIYCPWCIVNDVEANFQSPTRSIQVVENALDYIAEGRGIDRFDENSYDSGDFPKVVFRYMVLATEVVHDGEVIPADRCGHCHSLLGE